MPSEGSVPWESEDKGPRFLTYLGQTLGPKGTSSVCW